MRRVRLIPALALVVGAALVLPACGGDESPEQPIEIPTETTTGALEKDEFIEEADAVCEEANSAIADFVEAGEGFSAAGEIADLRQGVIDEITDLGAPDEDRATLDSFLAGMEAQVEAGEKIALANERGTDTAQFETELDNAQAETLTAAESYGFTVCGKEATSGATAGAGDATAAPTEPSAPVAPAPSTGDAGGVGDTGGGTGDTGGDTGSGGGVSPGGGISP